MAGEGASKPIRTFRDIPGWFSPADQWLFERFLSADALAPHGDLVELGVYLGKSAAFIGAHKHPDETFTVCDLFGDAAGDASNEAENKKSYGTLTRAKFERNYRAVLAESPVVIQGPSSTILDHVRPGTVRFVHVDASHLYEHVVVDIESARTMLLPNGVVAFDDFRSPHTPGVAAAVWEAAVTKGMSPICLTQRKMYATFGDARAQHDLVLGWVAASEVYQAEVQQIAGHSIVRIKQPPPVKRAAQPPARRSVPARALARARRLVRDLRQTHKQG